MRFHLLSAIAMGTIGAASLAAQQAAPLTLVRALQLPEAVKGPFDHLTVDLKHNHLFVTPEQYKAVLVLDLASGKVIHEISGIAKPHAILYREDLNRLYITDGGDGALKIFDATTFRQVGNVPLLKDADSIGYEPARHLLYIDNGGKDVGEKYSMLSIVDTTAGKKLSDIRIDGDTLEAMALDVFRPRMYVNNKARNQIEVVDRWKAAVVAAWPVTLAKDNVAIALDEPHQRLFVGCRSGQIVVFDTNTGRELQALPIATGIDDLIYDAGTKRIYAAANGVVSVYQQTDADRYKALGDVPSGPGGRTALLVPSLNRYFVSIPASTGQNASIAEMETVGVTPIPQQTQVAAIVVHAPAAQELLLSTMSAHPYLRKMGLHAIPPGGTVSVIVANANASRIGVESTAGDLEAVKDGKTFCAKRDDGSYYNLKMPMFDGTGRKIGILVMELPYTSATDTDDAVRQAESLRAELARHIPDSGALFQ